MCATYVLSEKDNEEIAQILSDIENRLGEKVGTGDIFPKNEAPVLLGDGPRLMLWGFPGYKGEGSVVYNARSETAFEKTMFGDSMKNRRCVIPATAFYEWSKSKKKYRFRRSDGKALYFGGCFKEFRGVYRYTILTRDADGAVSPVHHRMPVILQKEDLDAWFKDPDEAARLLASAQPELESEIA